MNRAVLKHIKDYLSQEPVKQWMAQMEDQVRPKAGPMRGISIYSLMTAKIYGAWMHRESDVRNGAQAFFNDIEDQADLQALGLTQNVSYDMLTDLQKRITNALTPDPGADLTSLESAYQEMLDVLVPAAVGPLGESLTVAVDTTLIQAYCTSRGCKEPHDGNERSLVLDTNEYEERETLDEMADRVRGEVSDASAEAKNRRAPAKKRNTKRGSASTKPARPPRGSCDPHAGHRAYQFPDGSLKKKILGYAAVAATQSSRELPEYVLRAAVIPAHRNDVPVAMELVRGMLRMYEVGPTRLTLTADRAFNNQWAAFSQPLVDMGAHFTYDLKKTDRFVLEVDDDDKQPQTFRGFLQICGRLFAPFMPRRLWVIELPSHLATKDEWDAYWQLEDERAKYELPTNGTPAFGQARFMSGTNPKARRWRCKHPKMWARTKDWDPALPLCLGDHGDDEACCLQSFTVRFTDMPRVWQFPGYGTREWKAEYDRRSAVERSFASVKYNCGWSPTHAKVRGIGAVAFSLAIAFTVHNLRLRYPEARRTPNLPRASTATRVTTNDLPAAA